MTRFVVFLIALCLAATFALAQPQPQPQPQPPRPAPDGELPALPSATVSVPWNELRALIERRGAAPDKAPVDYIFSNARYTVTTSDKSASIAAEADVSIPNPQWVLIPLGAGHGLLSVTADGEPAPVVRVGPNLAALLNGKSKAKVKLAMNLELPVVADAAASRISIPLLPSPIVTLSATIPQTNLDVKAPAATGVSIAEKDKQTTVTATYQGGESAVLIWRHRPAVGAQAARTYADGQTLISIERGLVRLQSRLAVRVERAATNELRLLVDPKAVIIGVTGHDVLRWTDEAREGVRGILVTFGSAAEGERILDITYERDILDAGGEITLDVVSVEGARRHHGVIGVRSLGAFDIRPVKSTADRISVSELPAELRPEDGSTQIGYRYTEQPASITLALDRVKKLPPRLFAATHTRVAVDRNIIRYTATIHYDIQHAPVDTLRVGLPENIEVLSTTGEAIRNTQVITEGKTRILVVGLRDVAKGAYALTIAYEQRLADKETTPTLALLSNPDAAADQGVIGIEVRGSYELIPTVEGARRIDVKELPQDIWQSARSPLLFGYRYDSPAARLTLGITRHEDLDVLVAMTDICEVTTTVTPDGKVVTKMMFIVRNNLKQFMTLQLPEKAELWSAFVADRPVTPARNSKGEILIPLRKSEQVEEDDDESYRAERERRRSARKGGRGHDRFEQARSLQDEDEPVDLKPYDVEIVFVSPAAKLEDRGQLTLALPKVDIPTGQVAWAIFLPTGLRIVDSEGNVREVASFSLPFRHFAETEQAKMEQMAQAVAQQKMQEAAVEALKAGAAMATGVLPVRVEIPITGVIHRFEKFLLVNEAPTITLTYHRKLQ